MTRSFITASFLCLVLTGCLSGVREDMERKGYSPAYSQGYEDGTASGKYASGGLGSQFKKDTVQFANNDQYRQGWTDGYDIGKTQEGDWQKTLKDLPKTSKKKSN